MFRNLLLGSLGIRGLSIAEQIDLAKRTGFAGVDINIKEVARLAAERGVDHVRALFESAGVRPGHFSIGRGWLEADWWTTEFPGLPALAAVGRQIGCVRVTTTMPSGSDQRPYDENFAWHVEQLRPIARTLREEGCRFGVEFFGTDHQVAGFKYPFIHTLDGLLDLVRAIDVDNVGILLDAFHLWASSGSVDGVDRLTNRDVVIAHVNDAQPGVPREEQQHRVRGLPGPGGIIDLPEFVRKLAKLGYDGPVTPEPFDAELAALGAASPLAAARRAAESLDWLWEAAGLG